MAKKEPKQKDRSMDALRKQFGDKAISFGISHKPDPHRIPCGIFPIDFATGGGPIPLWHSACFWGPEKGGKSSLAADTIAQAQNICWKCFNPLDVCICSTPALKMKGVLGNVEGTFDPLWYSSIGVNNDELIVIEGDSGEEFADMFKAVLEVDDVGLLVVDSLAGMSPSAEIEASSADNFYALQSKLIGPLVRILKQELLREKKRGHPCAILFTNQMRMKIGVQFGNPETMTGGFGMKHEFSLVLRVNDIALTKNDKDKFSSDREEEMPVVTRHSFAIKEHKVFILAVSGQYVRANEYIPAYDLQRGRVDDLTVLVNYAKRYGIIKKEKNSWNYFDQTSSTLGKIETFLKQRPSEKFRLQNAVIELAKKQVISGLGACDGTEDVRAVQPEEGDSSE